MLCCERYLNLLSLLRLWLAMAARVLACVCSPRDLRIKPMTLPRGLYSMALCCSIIGKVFRRDIGMILNLFVFVLIFHLFSKLFMSVMARVVVVAATCAGCLPDDI